MTLVKKKWAASGSVVFAFALMGSSALAQPAVTQSEAQAIAEVIRNEFALSMSGAGLSLDGDIEVVPQGTSYRVRIPALSGTVENSDDAGTTLDVSGASLGFSLTPLSDTLYRVSDLDMPATILEVTGPEGTIEVTVRGDRRLEGEWSTLYQNFINLDALWSSISITQNGVELGRIGAIDLDSTSTGSDVIDQDVTFAIRDIAVTQNDTGGEFRIGGLELVSRGTGIDLAEYIRFTRRLQEFSQVVEPTPADLRDLHDFLAGMKQIMTSSLNTFRLRDMHVVSPEDGLNVGLGELSIEANLLDLDTDAASVAFNYAHNGLSIDPSPYPPELLPRDMRMNLSLVKLPTDALWSTVLDALATAPGQDPDAVAAQLGMTLLNAAVQAGSQIVIEPLSLASTSTDLNLNGRGDLAPGSPYGFVGKATLLARGLEAAIDAASTLPDPEQAMQAQMMLGMLQALGKGERNAAGEMVRRYDFELTADGQMLLNGMPLDQALQ